MNMVYHSNQGITDDATGDERATAVVIALMDKHCISRHAVAIKASTDDGTVKRVLDPSMFRGVRYGTVIRVRRAVEKAMAESGWAGSPVDLWDEYDRPLREAA